MDGVMETVAKGKGKGKAKGKKVKKAEPVEEEAAPVEKKTKRVMQSEKTTAPAEKEKRELPKRKIVRAGDETETDVSGGGRTRK